ncbi:MAG: cysteine hydrolase family protein [Hyphomicrobiaceae bacterium]
MPERTALLLIDMQKEFFPREAFASDDLEQRAPDPMSAIIPRVVMLADLARASGIRVIHTREAYAADLSDVSSYRASLGYVGHPGPLGRTLVRGEASHDFLDCLQPAPGETVIDKPGFSAFHASPLDHVLRSSGIDHLVIAGVTTQCCVHSTLRSAVDLGYWCLTVADCCAASEPHLHDGTLAIIAGEGHLFGWICDLADVATALAPEASPALGTVETTSSGSPGGAKPRTSRPRPPPRGR